VRYRIEQVEIPAERILVQPDAADGTNDGFKKGLQYRGWKRSMEPVASFDAKTTEWELAKLFDAQDDIAWWLRTYVPGEVYIPTAAGRYYPDFVLLDSDGVQWIVEGKADSDAGRADVQAKRQEAENWARAVSDEGGHGQWRYLFATESHIKNSAGSWRELLAWANPD
jgi:type III restriction enzyme